MQPIGQIVVFTLRGQQLSLPTHEVVEIIRLREITPIPGTAVHIAGIINLRGNIIPVVHLSILCGLDVKAYTVKSRIVVVAAGGERIGMIVDDVIMVATARDEQLDEVPDLPGFLRKAFFRGFVKWEGSMIGILRLDQILQQSG